MPIVYMSNSADSGGCDTPLRPAAEGARAAWHDHAWQPFTAAGQSHKEEYVCHHLIFTSASPMSIMLQLMDRACAQLCGHISVFVCSHHTHFFYTFEVVLSALSFWERTVYVMYFERLDNLFISRAKWMHGFPNCNLYDILRQIFIYRDVWTLLCIIMYICLQPEDDFVPFFLNLAIFSEKSVTMTSQLRSIGILCCRSSY